MNLEEYKFLYELEEHLWWFVGMRKITASLLDNQDLSGPVRILDAGCGTGLTMSWLKRYGGNGITYGMDASLEALHYCHQRGQMLLVRGSLADLPFPSNTFDFIITLDVLDSFSVEDSVRPFAELARVLKEGGLIFVRVPAIQFLYSEHDRAVFTAHRYTARELARNMRQQGLVLERVTYANTLLFPVAAVWRVLRSFRRRGKLRSDVKPLPKGFRWLNPLLAWILSAEGAWFKHFRWRLPFGLSVVALARKPPPR